VAPTAAPNSTYPIEDTHNPTTSAAQVDGYATNDEGECSPIQHEEEGCGPSQHEEAGGVQPKHNTKPNTKRGWRDAAQTQHEEVEEGCSPAQRDEEEEDTCTPTQRDEEEEDASSPTQRDEEEEDA